MQNKSITKRILFFFQLPETLLVGSFAAVILLGAVLLTLPWAQQAVWVGFLDALFTSTSAVCVTGLVVVDTGTAFNRFGQTVIVLLIQAGGLGIMTFAALAYQLLGRRLSLRSQAVIHGTFFQQDLGINFKRMFKHILWITAITELIGAALLFAALALRQAPVGEALFSSFFHAVSAFCNAGFSIYKDNLVGLRDSHIFMTVIMSLIVIGGLGHLVVWEVWQQIRGRLSPGLGPGTLSRLSPHARVVLRVSGILIFGGAGVLLLLGLTKEETTWGIKVSSALFQSVTARTAGFNSVDIGLLPVSSILLLVLLMFIGGSPASCAGGIKTTALAISYADLRAKLRGEEEATLMDRRIPPETIQRVSLLIRLAVLWNFLGVMLLLISECPRPGIGLHDLLFEQISAFGTVGLSTGITDKLTPVGKLWIIATMFVGRLGPLTLAMWMLPQKQIHLRHPEGRILIG